MASPPRLSVVIPHLNEPHELGRCLASLAAQRSCGIPFEIIVVDNGSAEAPVRVCAGLPDVRLEIEATPGPGPARNRGAGLARAGLIAFIDADCVARPGWVRAIVDHFEANPRTGFAGGDIGILPADPGRLTAVEAYESIYSYRARAYVEKHGFAATGNMAVRAQVFRAVGPFGGIATMEDTEWGRRASAMGFAGAYLAEAKVLTGPCRSFAELAGRWDRHVAHEFRSVGGDAGKLARWLLTSALVALSPAAEIVTVARTQRVEGPGTRCRALACLARIRLYRARRMLALALRDDSAAVVASWNRKTS